MSEILKERLLIVSTTMSFFLLLLFSIWFFSPKTHLKIAYVRVAVIIEKYHGTREAQRKLQTQTDSWQANTDTLKKAYQQLLDSTVKAENGKLSQKAKEFLQAKQYEFQNYANSAQQKTQSEEQKLMGGVFKQINSYIEQYAKDNGYDLILGTTNEGSLRYGHKAIDITEDVTDALNKQYKK
jgi:outer membrane protein